MKFLEDLASRRRFGMRPGLDAIRSVCSALGDPQKGFRAIHVAGTNGKGAVSAILDSALRSARLRIGRYTSPHLVKLNERFFLNGQPISDDLLESAAEKVEKSQATNHQPPATNHQPPATNHQPPATNHQPPATNHQLTFFEALTAVAYLVYNEAKVDYAVLETGLGGRLDATNVCEPVISVITRIGLDHCDWLGDTVEKIAAEKAGIIRAGVPVVLGANCGEVRAVVEARAKELGAPFFYAPDIAGEAEIPDGFSLAGAFNRENAVTAIAALKVMNCRGKLDGLESLDSLEKLDSRFLPGFSKVAWPGRFQRVGDFIVDGAHNPPAARALAESLKPLNPPVPKTLTLIAGFCGDKDVGEVLSILAPFVKKGYAVRTNNPRSLSAEETAAKMREAGIDAIPCASLAEAIGMCRSANTLTLVCGSLFLAGEALVELGAYPWQSDRFDKSELLRSI